MNVPFVDLKRPLKEIRNELDAEIKKIIDNTAFILGDAVKEFEENFAQYCNAKSSVAVNSGTAALHLALISAGIKPGDEVITVPNSFIATCESISHAFAKPVFVDINENYLIDVNKIEEKITEKTKAIIPVHLYGQPADMKPLMEIAEKHDLKVIEDACQSHGAEYNGKKTGSLADAAAFSFYPAKNLGAFGEGGAIVSNNEEIIEKAMMFRAHGEKPKNTHSFIGYNYRMEGLQGAVLKTKLKYLDKENAGRIKAAEKYFSLLKDLDLILPKKMSYAKHVFHLFVIRTKKRDELREKLSNAGIATGVHYTTPIYLQKAYSFLNYKKGDFPITEKVMNEIISLPMFGSITEEEINYVSEKLKELI